MTVNYRPGVARGELVTPEKAAELIDVSRNVIDVWAHRGHLERLRLGRRVWFWSDDVYDLGHSRRQMTRP